MVDAGTGLDGVTVWRFASDAATVEERLSVLRANLETLAGLHERASARALRDAAALYADLSRETSARSAADAETRERLDRLAVGGVRYELLGALWLLVGIPMAGFASDFARWFGA
jgi:hypothetical protein